MTTTARRPQLVLYEAILDRPKTEAGFTVIEGRAVPYGVWTNRGWFMESIAPGTFDKSIVENPATPLHLFHDADRFPVGVASSWTPKRDALYGSWRLDAGPEAQRAAQLAADGMLVYLSVGHLPIRSSWEYVDADAWDPDLGPDHMDKLTRVESRLVEVSMLTSPAFPQAQILAVASADRDPETRRRRDIVRPSLHAWQSWASTLPTR